MSAQFLTPISPDLCGEQRAEPVPPEPHRFVADVDPAFMSQILHVSERQREPDVHHHGKADYVGTGFKILEWVAF